MTWAWALRTLAMLSILILMLSQVRRFETWQGLALLFGSGSALMYWLGSYDDRQRRRAQEQLVSPDDLKAIRRSSNIWTAMLLGIWLIFIGLLLTFSE